MTSTAKSSPLASIFGSTPEEDAKLAQLREAQERLQSALMDRKPMFDPMLLAMAQGFLAPNPSGNFFNALGNVAGKVGQAQEVEEKRQLERMQLQNELLKSQFDQMVQAREAQQIAGIVGGLKPVSGLQMPGQSAEAEQSLAPPPATSITSSGVGSRLSETSDLDLARLKLMRDRRGEQLANLIIAIRKGERDDMLVLPDGTLINVRKPGEVIRQGFQGAATETYVPELDGTVLMIPYERQRYQELKQQAQSQGWYDSFAEQYKNYKGDLSRIKNPNIPQNAIITPEEKLAGGVPFGSSAILGAPLAPRPGAVSSADQSGGTGPLSRGVAAPAGIGGSGRTKEDQERAKRAYETQEAIRQAEGIERAKGNIALEESIFSAGKIAPDIARQAQMLIDLASKPETKGAFGILATSGFLGSLGQVAESALRVGSYTLGIPSIEKAIRTATGTAAEIRAAEVAGSASTMLELNFRQLFLKGQGAISNMETEAVRQLAGTISDTPEGIVAKARLIKLRSEFDSKTADIFRAAQKRGISVRDFKDEDEYKAAVRDYDAGIAGVLQSIRNLSSSRGSRPQRPGPPPAGSSNPAPAAPSPSAVPPGALPPRFRPG